MANEQTLIFKKLVNTMVGYDFTQGRGEQEGKALANHLSGESSKKEQICVHKWSIELIWGSLYRSEISFYNQCSNTNQ